MAVTRTVPRFVLLSDLLSPDRIKVPLQSSDKEGLLSELVELVTVDCDEQRRRSLLRAVRDREAVLSTGIGNGVAIPHGKSGALDELRLAAGVTADPVDFDALDGAPVSLFFLLVGPETSAGHHVKALSRISRLLRKDDLRRRLISARSSDEFIETLRELEGA
ncbi:MAG TPA: PTS sugar transporter subunit IIA [Longimicrobiales bacterium]|nr:PTS sugar transporter subunit IIA [Longimicrobiales bacterium]